VAKVFREALEVIIALKVIAVFKEVKIITDISRYLYAKKVLYL
jgi:hypothetical protein